MFGKAKLKEPTGIDAIIARVLLEMEMYGPESEDYDKLLTYLERLEKVRRESARPMVSADTAAIVGGNLLGILIIVMYEQKHVMVSKAVSFVMKAR